MSRAKSGCPTHVAQHLMGVTHMGEAVDGGGVDDAGVDDRVVVGAGVVVGEGAGAVVRSAR